MTAIEHSILATFVIAVFYYFGHWKGRKEKVDDVVEYTLDTLEANGFIITEWDGKEKQLQKVQKLIDNEVKV